MSSRRRKLQNDLGTGKRSMNNPPSHDSPFALENSVNFSKSSLVVFLLFAVARLISARFNNINDCDETFNYWEPAHFLLYGKGFQTWEYSPVYAIRSYFFLWLHMIPAYFAKLLHLNIDKITVFYLTRICLALVGALVESFLYSAIKRSFNRKVSVYYCILSLFSSGMFISSTAFLPSSFGQIMTGLSVGFWLNGHYRSFIFCTAFSAIVGWPFCAAISLPFALYVLYDKKLKFIKWSLTYGLLIMILTILVDSYYYGKVVFANLNIVLYNVFSSNGPELYGTEPFYYYMINLFLNFNFVPFVLAVYFIYLAYQGIAFIYTKIFKKRKLRETSSVKEAFTMLSMYLWVLNFTLQSHKEERFMYPVYTLILLNAAVALVNAQNLLSALLPKLQKIITFFTWVFFLVFILLSVSRTIALYKGYSASLNIYMKLEDFSKSKMSQSNETVLCLAKEWHRFPSNFLVPEGVRVEFIPSEFRGQLPKYFDSSVKYPTRIIPSHMNDMNKEEISRYVPLSTCDLLIDSAYSQEYGRDLPYSRNTAQWSTVGSLPFLDSSRSSSIFRAFYIPILSEKYCKYIDYNLLSNKNIAL